MKLSDILPLDRVIINDSEVPGFSANAKKYDKRAESFEFHDTIPGYWEITTISSGEHPKVQEKYTWKTRILFQKGIVRPAAYKCESLRSFVVWHDCEITKVELKQGEGINPDNALLLHGVWQFIHLKRPGLKGLIVIPRPLVEIPEKK